MNQSIRTEMKNIYMKSFNLQKLFDFPHQPVHRESYRSYESCSCNKKWAMFIWLITILSCIWGLRDKQ
jgi:hypothetical protein